MNNQQFGVYQMPIGLDWRNTLTDSERSPMIDRLVSIMRNSQFAKGKNKQELYAKVRELESIELKKATSKEQFLTSMNAMLRNAEMKLAGGQQQQQYANMTPSMMQSLMQKNMMGNQQQFRPPQQGFTSPLTSAQVNSILQPYVALSANSKRDPVVERAYLEFESKKPKAIYERKSLQDVEKIQVMSFLNVLKTIHPHFDSLIYNMFVHRSLFEDQLAKLMGIKFALAEQFHVAQQDVFYFTPAHCHQVLIALGELMTSWSEFYRRSPPGTTPRTMSPPGPSSTYNAIIETLKKDFVLDTGFQFDGFDCITPFLYPFISYLRIENRPKSKIPSLGMNFLIEEASALFGPCKLVDVDDVMFKNESSNVAFGFPLEEELEMIASSLSLQKNSFKLGHYVSVIFIGKQGTLGLSISNYPSYVSGHGALIKDVAEGFAAGKVELLDQLLAKHAPLQTIAEAMFAL